MTPRRVMFKMNSMTNFVLRNKSRREKIDDEVENVPTSPRPQRAPDYHELPLREIFEQEAREYPEEIRNVTPRQLRELERRRRLHKANQEQSRQIQQPDPSFVSTTDEEPQSPREHVNMDSANTFARNRMSQNGQIRTQLQTTQQALNTAISNQATLQSQGQQYEIGEKIRIVKGDSYPATSSGRTDEDILSDHIQTNGLVEVQDTYLLQKQPYQYQYSQEKSHTSPSNTYNHPLVGSITTLQHNPNIRDEGASTLDQSQRTPVQHNYQNLPVSLGKDDTCNLVNGSTPLEHSAIAHVSESKLPQIAANLPSSFASDILNLTKVDNATIDHVNAYSSTPKHYDANSSADNLFSMESAYLDKLKSLDFSALEEEPFELSSTLDVDILSPELAKGSLEDKLKQVSRLDELRQRSFMASLAKDEWDDAGDWFVEQFAEITAQLQKCRRERRDLARKFELILTERHASIMREEQDLEEAVKNMKATGGILVRQGTQTSKSKRGA